MAVGCLASRTPMAGPRLVADGQEGSERKHPVERDRNPAARGRRGRPLKGLQRAAIYPGLACDHPRARDRNYATATCWATRRISSIPSEAARWINAFPMARCTRCGIMDGPARPNVSFLAM